MDFRRAKELLAGADQIVFMGFGYSETNLKRLGIGDLPDGKAIGTCHGLGARGQEAAKRASNNKVKLIDGDCTHFAREIIDWC